ALGVLALGTIMGGGWALRTSHRSTEAARRRALDLLPLGAAALVLGLFGGVHAGYSAATAAGARVGGEVTARAGGIERGATLAALGLVIALTAGAACLFLFGRIAAIEQVERLGLLEADFT